MDKLKELLEVAMEYESKGLHKDIIIACVNASVYEVATIKPATENNVICNAGDN